MKILFWVGYQNPYWTKQTYLDKGIGGSEYCVLKLADYLDLKGHDGPKVDQGQKNLDEHINLMKILD